MTLQVVRMRLASKAEWDRIWSGCAYATYFQSREWSEIWQHSSCGNLVPSPYLLDFSDGRHAIFPMTWDNTDLKYLSSPGGTYGGLISLMPLDGLHHTVAALAVRQRLGSLFLRLNAIGDVAEVSGFPGMHHDETDVLCLDGGFDEVYRNWSDRHKRATMKAQKEGVEVRTASSEEHWRAYFDIYQSSLERWGTNASSHYYWSFFKTMMERNSRNIRLWLSFYHGRPVAGALCLYAKNHVGYWHGAALSDYFQVKPVQLLFYEAILHASSKGYCYFDFNPSGGHAGVRSFKQGFGTVTLPTPWIELEGERLPCGWRGRLADLRRQLGRYIYDHGM
jgi:hypothetical protein